MTDETTADAYEALMAAVEAYGIGLRMRKDGHYVGRDDAVRREAERLVLGQQIAVLMEIGSEVGADCADGIAFGVSCKNPRCRKLAELRAALAALDGEG